MHPASLVTRSGKDLVERLPEAECTVTNGDFWSDLQSPSFHIDEKFAPALRAFPNANLETDEFLLALRRSPDQHQHAFAVFFHASLQKYTVGPHIQVSARRQIPLLPMPVLALPLRRQTGNHRRRQVLHPCPTSPPMPPGSLRSRCHADKEPAEAHPGSSFAVPTTARSPR